MKKSQTFRFRVARTRSGQTAACWCPHRGWGRQQEEMQKDSCSLWVMQRCPVTEVRLHNEMC